MSKILKITLIFLITFIIDLNSLYSQIAYEVKFPNGPNNVISTTWKFYASSAIGNGVEAKYKSASGEYPGHIATRVYNGGNWNLMPDHSIDVRNHKGKTFVFRAIIAGRFLGNFSNHSNAGLQLEILKYSSSAATGVSGNSSELLTGNFSWKEIKVEFTVDNTTEYIKPRLIGWYGGGEMFLYQASCTLKEEPSTLHFPSFFTNTPELSWPMLPGVNANGFTERDENSWTLYCANKEGVVNPTIDGNNNLFRPLITSFHNAASNNYSTKEAPTSSDLSFNNARIPADNEYFNDSKSYLTTGVYNNSEWSLDAGKYNIPSNTKLPYIFSAVIAGRSIGEISPGGAGMWLQIVPITTEKTEWSKAVFSENIKGTFSWKQVNVKINPVDLPPNTIALQPRFYSTSGGGEMYVSSASFYPFEKNPQLTIPPHLDLPEPLYKTINGFEANGFVQEDVDKWTLYCGRKEGVVNPAYDAANNLFRPLIQSYPNLSSRKYIATAVYNNADWALGAGKFILPSNTKRDYTFSAVIAGRSLGEVRSLGDSESKGDGMWLQIVPITTEKTEWGKAVFSENIIGTFSWKQVNVKIKSADLPPNTIALQPRFYSTSGGGELFIASAAFTPYDNAPKLSIPPSNVLPDTYYNLLPDLNEGFSISPDISKSWNLYASQKDGRPGTVYGEFIDANLNIKTDRVSHLQTSVFNEGSWALSSPTKIPVNTTKTFTFTAIIAGNHLGKITKDNDGGARLEILEYTSSDGTPINNWEVATMSKTFAGTFGWRTVSVTVTVGTNTKFIQPRFYCWKGGGEMYVYKAILQPVVSSIELEKPTDPGMPVSRKNVSAIFTPSVGTLSNGWDYWERNNYGQSSYCNAESRYNNVGNINSSYIGVNRINNSIPEGENDSKVNWDLQPNHLFYEVKPGASYTFTAVVKVNKNSTKKAKGEWGPQINFLCFKEKVAETIDWESSKTYGERFEIENTWRKISAKITVPPSIKYIRPRIIGYSQANFFLADALLLEEGVNESLNIPADGITIQTVNSDGTDNNHGLYTTVSNQKIRWNIRRSEFSGEINYVVSGPKGEVYESSKITLSNSADTRITFPSTDVLNPGYYELKIIGILSKVGENETFPVQAFSSAAAFPENPDFAFGNGHFGTKDIPFGDDVYKILNMTWDNPESYNIIAKVDSTRKKLPSFESLPAYQQAWVNKMKDPQDKLKHAKYINSVRIWNEPTNEKAVDTIPGFKGLKKGNEFLCNMDYQPFVNMLQATKSGIKSVDPSTKILLNIEWPNWYTDFPNGLNHITSIFGDKENACQLYDIMTPHPYLMRLYKGSPLGPEIVATNVYSKNDWNETTKIPLTDEYDKNNLLYRLDKYEIASRFCPKPKEMWSTEFGWPTSVVSEVDQARFIVRSALLQFSFGFKKVMAHRFSDLPWMHPLELSFGLAKAINFWDNKFIPKPALFAYSFLSHTIKNLPYNGRFDLGKNIGCFVFGDNNNTGTSKRTVIALWNPEANCNVSLNIPTGTSTRIVDIFGKTYSSIPTIGEDPVYIIIDESNPSEIDDLNVANIIVGKPPVDLFDIVR